MRYLESFSDRYPIDSEVSMWQTYLDDNYNRFGETEFGKMVTVDDKSYFLKDKSQLTDRIFYDIKNQSGVKIHEPSLRRAIKNWIDKNNI